MIEPRILTDKQTAAYLSLPLTDVQKLTFGRIRLGAKLRFDRRALDAHLDALSGLAPQSARAGGAGPDDDAEAAFDRFTESRPDAPRRC